MCSMSIWRLQRGQAEIGTLPSGATLRGWIGAGPAAARYCTPFVTFLLGERRRLLVLNSPGAAVAEPFMANVDNGNPVGAYG